MLLHGATDSGFRDTFRGVNVACFLLVGSKLSSLTNSMEEPTTVMIPHFPGPCVVTGVGTLGDSLEERTSRAIRVRISIMFSLYSGPAHGAP